MKNIVKTAVITALFISQAISPNYFGACWDSMKASFNRDEQYIRADIQNQQAKTDANISKAIDTLGWEPIYSLEDIVKTEIEYQSAKKK